MAKSDTESCTDSPITGDYKNLEQVVDNVLDRSNDNTIHSGHFMVSCVHQNGEEDDSDTDEQSGEEGFDFVGASKETSKTYQFGNRSVHTMAIDASLTKLFECMTLAYSGKLTSPKWKTFKGLKLMLKDKIRLNNIIWREWNMQFIQSKRPIVCQFSCPISDETHYKPEAVVLEGKYWKRRLESVTYEYKKWRSYFKERHSRQPIDHSMIDVLSHAELLEKVSRHDIFRFVSQPPQAMSPLQHMDEQDDFIMDFSDTLFSSLNQPFVFPNPKELSQLGNADIMQPGLVQLQPNLDDFMDTIEPLHDLVYPWKTSENKEMQDYVQPSWKSLDYRPFTDIIDPPPRQTPSPMMQGMNMMSYSPVDYSVSPQAMMSSPHASSPVQAAPPTTVQSNKGNQRFPVTNSVSLNSSSLFTENMQQPHPVAMTPNFSSPAASPGASTITIDGTQVITDINQIRNLLNTPQFQQQPAAQQQQATQQQQQSVNTPLQTLIISNLTTPSSLANTPIQTLNIPHSPSQMLSLTQPNTVTYTTQQQSPIISSSNELLAKALQQQQQQQQPYGLNQNDMDMLITNTNAASTSNLNKLLMGTNSRARNLSGGIVMSNPSFVSTLSSLIPPQQQSPTTILSQMSPSGKTPKGTNRRSSTGSSSSSAGAINSPPQMTANSQHSKREGEFLVPKGKPTMSRSKQRNIAPAPAAGSPAKTKTPASQQNTFLAQLLTTGTYPGATVTVKQENQPLSPPSSFPLIQAAPPTSAAQNLTFALSSATNVSDFQKNMILAAASQALGTSKDKLLDAVSPSATSLARREDSQSPQSPKFQVPSPPSFQVASPAGSDGGSTGNRSLAEAGNSVTSDESPVRAFRPKNDSERQLYREHRRVSHISAEQKRRCNIKNGFDTLHVLVPALSCNPNSKISKAATLQKTADFLKKLKQERSGMQEEADLLRKEIENLNISINTCQAQLPATGVPVTRQRVDQMRDMFDEYVRSRTLQNWKFWIFSIIIRPLFDSYNNLVSTASMDEICRTVLAWLDQHCSLVALRPAVLNSLRHLSTTTSILSDPSKVPEQAAAAVAKQPGLGHSS